METEADTSYIASLAFPGGLFGSNGFSLIEVDDATGEVVQTREGVISNIAFSSKPGSSFFLQVVPGTGAAANSLYEVSLTEYTDDFADNTSTTAVLAGGETISLAREIATDFDFARLDVEAGKSYRITGTDFFDIVRGDALALTTAGSSGVLGFDFADARTDFGAFSFTNTEISARLDAEAGVDYFLVTAGSQITRDFTLTEVTAETPDNASSTVAVAANQTIAGVFEERSDQDWIRLDIAAGDSFVLELSGFTAKLRVFAVLGDGTVEEVESRVSIVANALSQTVVTGRSDATLFAQVGAIEGRSVEGTLGVQAYSVSLTPLSDDFTDAPTDAGTLGEAPAIDVVGDGTDESFSGSDLADTISGGGGDDKIHGFGGDDDLNGGGGNDTVNGGAGDDLINGGTGADAMSGGLGDDIFVVNSSADQVSEGAGEGTDLVRSIATFTLSENVENLALGGTAQISGTGNGLANVLNGNTNRNTLTGEDGDDILNGQGAIDTLIGGAGNDRLNGGIGADRMEGGLGDDVYIINSVGDVVVDLVGEGTDTVQSVVSFALGDHTEELILTGAGANTGTGNALDNVIRGNNGANTLTGEDGADIVTGGGGDDSVSGGGGADTLGGGLGNDEISGGAEDDVISGQGGADTIDGGTGNDRINAGTGDDVITGGIGNDTLTGAGGADTLTGGTGDDRQTGGGGADRFVFEDGFGNDVLIGFSRVEDVIDLSGVTGITDFADLVANHLSQDAGGALITDGTDTILLSGVQSGLLADDDFDFVGVSPPGKEAAARVVIFFRQLSR
ncbi:MAG: calcium-binding protein [Pseudomonadota bacterium]